MGELRPPQGGRERRRLRRIGSRISVQFQAGTLRGTGHIKNLTQEGLFVRSHILPEPGESVYVTLTTPEGTKIEVTGVVRWTTAQMAQAGAARISVGSSMSRAAYGALVRAAEDMLETGSFRWAADALPFTRIQELFGG